MVRLKAEFLAITVISECQDILTIKAFIGFLILIFVISTLDSIDEHTFYMNKNKKIFSRSPWGTTDPKIFF